jgi:hypothetical protein
MQGAQADMPMSIQVGCVGQAGMEDGACMTCSRLVKGVC